MVPPSLHTHDPVLLAGAHLALAGLLGVVGVQRVRAGELTPRALAGWLGAAAAWAGLALGVLGPALPVAWVSPLREGFTLSHLRLLTGIGTDTGPVRDVLWLPLLTGARTLRALVTVDLVFAGWTALLLAAWTRALGVRGALGPVLVAAASLGPAGLATATTEVGAAVVGTYALAGAGLYVLAVRPGASWVERGPAGLAALLTGLLLVGVRAELLVLLALGGAGLALAWGLPGLRARLERAAAQGVAWLGRRAWLVLLVGAAWVGLSVALYDGAGDLRGWGSWSWLIRGLHPLHVHGLTLAVVLPAVLSPGLALLAARGAWRALAAPVTSAALPLAVWVLYVTMRQAAHGGDTVGEARTVAPWELYRYLLVLLPLATLLAAWGAQGVRRPGLWAALCLLPPVPELSRLLAVEGGPGADWPRVVGVQGDAPAEVRALLARTEEAPACGVLTLGAPWLPERGEAVPRLTWAALVPGPLGWEVRTSAAVPSTPAAEVAAELLAGVPCARAWRSLDCGALAASEAGAAPHPSLPGCAPLDALPVLSRASWPSRPFVHPQHTLAWTDPVQVGWSSVPGWPDGVD